MNDEENNKKKNRKKTNIFVLIGSIITVAGFIYLVIAILLAPRLNIDNELVMIVPGFIVTFFGAIFIIVSRILTNSVKAIKNQKKIKNQEDNKISNVNYNPNKKVDDNDPNKVVAIKCPKCGALNDINSKRCHLCNSYLDNRCPNCGSELYENSSKCPRCGYEFKNNRK